VTKLRVTTRYELRLTEESGKVTVSIQYLRCFFARIVNVLLLILLLLMMMMMRKGEEMSVGAVSMRLVSGDLPVDRQPPAYQRSSRAATAAEQNTAVLSSRSWNDTLRYFAAE